MTPVTTIVDRAGAKALAQPVPPRPLTCERCGAVHDPELNPAVRVEIEWPADVDPMVLCWNCMEELGV